MKDTVMIFDETSVVGRVMAQELVQRGLPVMYFRERIGGAAEKIAEVSPKAVIVIVYSDAETAAAALAALKKRFPEVRFITGVFSSLGPGHIRALSAAASYCFSVPVENETVYNNIIRVLIREDVSSADAEDFLYRCGFNDKVKGFRYLASAMDICISDVQLLSGGITQVYRRVAERFRTKAVSVERDVRTFICMPQQSGAVARIRYGRAKSSASSNKEMIAMACDAFVVSLRTGS